MTRVKKISKWDLLLFGSFFWPIQLPGIVRTGSTPLVLLGSPDQQAPPGAQVSQDDLACIYIHPRLAIITVPSSSLLPHFLISSTVLITCFRFYICVPVLQWAPVC